MKKTINLIYFLLLLLPSFIQAQQFLKLQDCSVKEFEVNDHSDLDGDGNVCETKILLSNSAYYEGDVCELSNIKWRVIVDLWKDGTDDLEYSSDLPPDDTTLDDTNGNGIPDLYIPRTTNNEVQNIQLPDIEGPFSNHSVRWRVSDDCDLGDLCAVNFTAVDKKAPTPFCVTLSTVIFDGTETEIFAEDFNIGVFDNCTDQEDIRISFSDESIVPSRLINCDDVVNSPISIQVYFWDSRDNIDLCTVFVVVNPEGAGNDCIEEREIFGKVEDCRGEPLKGIEVTLDAQLPEYPLTRITDDEGKYSFGVLPNNVEYQLSASFDDNFLSGLSTLDLVKIVRHLLEIETFTNPYKIIAADVNGDHQLKVQDVVALRKLILGVISEVPGSPSWRFIDADFEFYDDMNPFPSILSADKSPYHIEFKHINLSGYDFVGIKVGDVSG